MTTSEKQIYRFGDVEVNPANGYLKRGDSELHLRRKSFQVLAYLLEHRERLVTKDELVENVWKETAVTDDTLVQCIKEIRRALGDNSQSPQFIKTFPKAGYRFIGSLEEPISEIHISEPVLLLKDSADSVPSQFHLRNFLIPSLILATVLFSIAFLSKDYWQPKQNLSEITLPQVPGKKSVAVMYFENQSKSSELDWLREGIADMLITNLSRSSKVSVLSRQQFHTLLEKSDTNSAEPISFEQAVKIARKSQATNFISGSFVKLNNKIRLDAQLYDSQNGSLLASENLIVDKPEQILTEIDLLSLKLVNCLGITPNDPEQPTTLTKAMTDNLEAYRNYSLGVEKAQALHNQEAISLLEKAIALDPQFAMAYARIGYVYAISSNSLDKGKPYLEKAFKLSERLTEKDRLNINAWYAIANQDYSAGIQNYREIISKYPLETESYWRLARLLTGEERPEEAIEFLKQGLVIDSEEKNLYNVLGGTLSILGRHDEAIAARQRYVALAPKESNAYDSLGMVYQWAGDYQSAILNYNRALELNPNFEIAIIHLANTYYQLGQYHKAIDLYRRYTGIVTSDPERARGYSYISKALLKKGDLDSAEKAALEKKKFSKDFIFELLPIAYQQHNYPKAKELEREFSSGSRSDRGARLTERFDQYIKGYIALQNGQTEDALISFKETVNKLPPTWDMDPLEDCLANAYLSLGRFDEAIAEYNRILQLNPNYPLTRFHLAQAYERKNQINDARANYQMFLEIWKDADADLPEVISAKSFLEKSSS